MTSDEILNNEKLMNYMNYVVEANKIINLTTITKKEDFIDKHLYDSIFIMDKFDFKNKKVMDLGTGAGFPGIPLAIMLKDTEFYLVEPSKKRCCFLEDTINKLDLKNVFIINKRVEELGNEYAEFFDFVVTRAVAKLNIIMEFCADFLKIKGILIAYKGLKYDEEIKESKKAFNILGLGYKKTLMSILPFSKDTRFYIIITKEKQTPSIYPRMYKEIKRNPL